MRDQLTTIRNAIALARQQEKTSGRLAKSLRHAVASMHNAIELPKQDAVEALVQFVESYIEHVPVFIEAITDLTREAGIYAYAQTLLDIAADFFIQPPNLIAEHTELGAMLDEAYLAHRLMEEVNDRFIGRCGIPLAPMDMTRSNIIVHYLIGEPFANELDHVVQYSVEVLMNKEKVFEDKAFRAYVDIHQSRGWSEELARWPCLAKDLSINLSFSGQKQQRLSH
ncbi:hypothetical protein FKG94_20470 [Exilibacterium tricleocarpae]|uniref:Uncharacterized protein n=1 Tax=Exilibacterium tricleocarpae TaxID=2591008 RepID=A0A545T0F9_9GAMM|nr:hypothetical protein [Exilibacterium tricleocarpae]TQV70708.1 hypothetical protein FKG94_20470 [Exilibacterium tricleocarpae]